MQHATKAGLAVRRLETVSLQEVRVATEKDNVEGWMDPGVSRRVRPKHFAKTAGEKKGRTIAEKIIAALADQELHLDKDLSSRLRPLKLRMILRFKFYRQVLKTLQVVSGKAPPFHGKECIVVIERFLFNGIRAFFYTFRP